MAITAAPTRTALGQKAGQDVSAGFIWWAHLLVAAVLLVTFLPPGFNQLMTIIRNGSVLLGALWIVIAMLRYQIRPRICFPIALLLILQAWGAFSATFVSAIYGRSIPFNYSDLLFLRYCYVFFVASTLIQLRADQRLYLVRTVFVICAINATVQYLQFLHFGPALALSSAGDLGFDLTNWDQRGGTRAAGFYAYSPHSALLDALVAAWFAGQYSVRKLSLREHTCFFFFVGASFIAQARTHLPGLALVFLVYLFYLVRHERQRAFPILAGLFAGLGVIVVVAFERLAYIFGAGYTASSLQYRSEVAWKEATPMLRDFPWTGVGPDPSVLANRTIFLDKWSLHRAVEQGWLALQAQYGLIGLWIGMFAMGVAVLAPAQIRPSPYESADRKALSVAVALMSLCIAIGMMGNTVLQYEHCFAILLMTAGLLMRNKREDTGFTRRLRGVTESGPDNA